MPFTKTYVFTGKPPNSPYGGGSVSTMVTLNGQAAVLEVTATLDSAEAAVVDVYDENYKQIGFAPKP